MSWLGGILGREECQDVCYKWIYKRPIRIEIHGNYTKANENNFIITFQNIYLYLTIYFRIPHIIFPSKKVSHMTGKLVIVFALHMKLSNLWIERILMEIWPLKLILPRPLILWIGPFFLGSYQSLVLIVDFVAWFILPWSLFIYM